MVLAKDGKPLHPQEFAALPEDEQASLQKILQGLEHELNEALHVTRRMEHELEEKMADLVRRVGQSVVDVAVEELQVQFSDSVPLVGYLQEVEKDILGPYYVVPIAHGGPRTRRDLSGPAAASLQKSMCSWIISRASMRLSSSNTTPRFRGY